MGGRTRHHWSPQPPTSAASFQLPVDGAFRGCPLFRHVTRFTATFENGWRQRNSRDRRTPQSLFAQDPQQCNLPAISSRSEAEGQAVKKVDSPSNASAGSPGRKCRADRPSGALQLGGSRAFQPVLLPHRLLELAQRQLSAAVAVDMEAKVCSEAGKRGIPHAASQRLHLGSARLRSSVRAFS